ncbi:PI-PLC X domain-containing protein 1 [Schistosoma japonicum]|nr:PI-PLC X domain-containing protein 1 [Schistosoma japonicum]KAH8875644.1 PI-PLC X domain-containing protein 1 [Schistosoma japonicum]
MINPRSWMSDLPSHISQKALNLISIPGSHDSFTYSITQHSPPSPDAPIFSLSRCLPRSILTRILYPWSVTQSLSLVEQLNAGIRYFDFRICARRKRFLKKYESTDYEFYLVHGQYANLLSTELESTLSFLQTNPKEVLIVDCNHFYNFKTDEQKDCFESIVLKILGSTMFPYQQNIPSLEDLWSAKQQIIFISCHRKAPEKIHLKFWPSHRIKSFWPETVDPLAMVSFLNDHIQPYHHRPNNTFCVHQGVLTPNKLFFLLHPFSSVRHLAEIAGKYYKQWLNKPNQLAGPDGINITLIDFFSTTYPTYIRDVVLINYKTWPTVEISK